MGIPMPKPKAACEPHCLSLEATDVEQPQTVSQRPPTADRSLAVGRRNQLIKVRGENSGGGSVGGK